jgi:hypothetical protein
LFAARDSFVLKVLQHRRSARRTALKVLKKISCAVRKTANVQKDVNQLMEKSVFSAQLVAFVQEVFMAAHAMQADTASRALSWRMANLVERVLKVLTLRLATEKHTFAHLALQELTVRIRAQLQSQAACLAQQASTVLNDP